MLNTLSLKDTGPFVVARNIEQDGEDFYRGIGTIIAEYFDIVGVDASIIPFEDSGIVIHSCRQGLMRGVLEEDIPTLTEPMSAKYGTFGLTPNKQIGTLLVISLLSEDLLVEQDALAKHKKSIGKLPTVPTMNLAHFSFSANPEFPRLNASILNQTALDLGVVDHEVTLAPAYYL